MCILKFKKGKLTKLISCEKDKILETIQNYKEAGFIHLETFNTYKDIQKTNSK